MCVKKLCHYCCTTPQIHLLSFESVANELCWLKNALLMVSRCAFAERVVAQTLSECCCITGDVCYVDTKLTYSTNSWTRAVVCIAAFSLRLYYLTAVSPNVLIALMWYCRNHSVFSRTWSYQSCGATMLVAPL